MRALFACLSLLSAATGLAAPIAFDFHQGPPDMIIPLYDFRSFHSTLTNTGDQPDTYTVTVTRQQPPDWYFTAIVQDEFYDEMQPVFMVPSFGQLAPGQSIDFAFEIFCLGPEGEAVYTVHLASNSDPSVQETVVYTARTPSEPYDLLLSVGENTAQAEVDQFVRFDAVLYNAGTMPDAYHLTMTRDLPDNWTATFCFDGICYPPTQDGSDIPDGGGQVFPGGAVPLEIDFTTTQDEGTGTVVVTIVSQTNPALVGEATFTLTAGGAVAVLDTPAAALSAVHAAPNPFNPRTEIRFDLGGQTARVVQVAIFDARGRLVRRLESGPLPPGRHGLVWNGETDAGDPAAAGLYVARIRAGSRQQTLKLSLVK